MFLPSPSSLLLKIPDEFKPLAALVIGAVILVLMVLFHGISLHKILVHFKRRELAPASRPSASVGSRIPLRLGHLPDAVAAYRGDHGLGLALLRLGLIVQPADALYFCANAYTTMGYGTVDLESSCGATSRPSLPSPACSPLPGPPALLVTMVANYMKIVEQLEIERAKQLDMRSAGRHAQWEAVHKEHQTEQDARSRRGRPPRLVLLRASQGLA